MEIRELERKTISLVPELVFMESDTVLVQYIISSWSLQYRNHSEYRESIIKELYLHTNLKSGDQNQGIDLKIVMNRRIMNEMLTTFLPSVFILGIVYATNFFKSFFFEAQVTVNLTSLLVLTTLFISVSKSLPPTAYVKMIDIWLIFAQLIPFVEVFRI